MLHNPSIDHTPEEMLAYLESNPSSAKLVRELRLDQDEERLKLYYEIEREYREAIAHTVERWNMAGYYS